MSDVFSARPAQAPVVPTALAGMPVLASKERPILFSGAMVRALLEGRKTQTRRIAKGLPERSLDFDRQWHANALRPSATLPKWSWWDGPPHGQSIYHTAPCPYGVPGDRLWVREAHYLTDNGDYEQVIYAEDEQAVAVHLREVESLEHAHRDIDWSRHRKLRPSIHMPRWASRLTLEITEVRVERVQDISYDDCAAEGTTCPIHGDRKHTACSGLRDGYRSLWESINGPGSWASNPWVWAVSFKARTTADDEQPGTAEAVNPNPLSDKLGGAS